MLKTISLATAILLGCCAGMARPEDPPATLWVRSWNAPANHEDIGRFVATDTPDRIYVAGTTYEPGVSGSAHDYLLLQYDASGNLGWYRRYGGQGSETLSDLAVPAPGEVIVTGLSPGANGLEVATVKYDRFGNLLWDRRHSAQGSTGDLGPKLAVDGQQNVIVCASDGGDYLILKYAPDGTLVWSRTYDGPASDVDTATGVAADGAGNVYVTGVANSLHAFATVKFNPSGDFQWDQIEPGDIGSVFAPSEVQVGPDGNPVIAGSPESTCGVFQFKIWKCASATGAVLWSDKEPNQPCDSFTFEDLTLDWTGAALSVCSGATGGAGTHMQVLRHAEDGTLGWIREFDGPGTGEDIAAAIATDGVGAAYAVGYTTFPPQDRDYAAVKISSAGQPEWTFSWASPQGTNDIGQDICVDPAGDVILTGHSYDPVENENAVTIKLHQASAAAVAGGPAVEMVPIQVRMVPNPVCGSAKISYRLPETGATRLDLIAADGRLLRRLFEGPSSSGLQEILWNGTGADGSRLPAGAYFLRLDAGGRTTTAKVSVVR